MQREASPGLHWVEVDYRDTGGFLERVPMSSAIRGPMRGQRQVAAGLSHGPYDALFFLTHNPAVLRPQTLLRTPTCLWTDVTPLQMDRQAAAYNHSLDRSALLRKAKRCAVTLTFRLAARCLAWSDWARSSFVRDYGVPEERTAVVRPGVELDLFSPVADAERAARTGPVRLLFVGGDFERKGGTLLLEALHDRLGSRCELDVVTRDDVAAAPGLRVHRGLTPQSEPLRKLFREADLFVLPTLADCHSIASIEAMACGLPVIFTRIGAGPEIVEEGRSGLLIEPGSGRALAAALDALLDDRARLRSMGSRGRVLAEERFDVRHTATGLLRHLQEVSRKEVPGNV